MINEVDEVLRSVVKGEILSGTDVDVVFDAPTRDWASRRNKPTLDMYLYDIREDLRRRETGFIERRNERGVVEERRELPRFFKLAYLITAWTQRPEDEHRLLAAALALFMRYDYLPAEYMTPLLRQTEAPLLVQIAYPPPEDRQVSDVWSSLGGDLKPSVDLIITMPVQPDSFLEVAKAVIAPLRLHSTAQKTLEADDGYRQLNRPGDATAPVAAAVATEEPAPAPSVGPGRSRPRRGDSPSGP
ncbi:MAG: DUF4255 domain-containing protein [Actinomycetota bacterium]|nr:DUF4255 domain-containing protein [Actinomycetota bacterium]